MTTPATPAELLQASLVAATVAVEPVAGAVWPVYVGHLPNTPDNAVCVYDSPGTLDGRNMATGVTLEHPGFQIRVRAKGYVVAYNKIAEIRDHIAAITKEGLVVRTVAYTIHAARLRSAIQPLGQEQEGARRDYLSLNGSMTLT